MLPLKYAAETSFHVDGCVYSVDMLRICGRFLKLKDYDGQKSFYMWLTQMGESAQLVYDHIEYTGGKIGKYRDLFNFEFAEDSTACLQVGPKLGTGKTDFVAWCFEFNPNKVSDQLAFRRIQSALLSRSKPTVDVKRYDLAVDFPAARNSCVLVKDQRIYKLVRAGTEDLTEYLGRRNSVGYCKLYNKALERGLSTDLTRLEVTLGYNLSYDEMLRIWPQCHVYGTGDLAAVQNLNEQHLSGGGQFAVRVVLREPALENELYLFDKKTRKKLNEILEQFRQAQVPSESVFRQIQSSIKFYLTPILTDM